MIFKQIQFSHLILEGNLLCVSKPHNIELELLPCWLQTFIEEKIQMQLLYLVVSLLTDNFFSFLQ